MSRTSPIGSLIWSKASSMRLVSLFQSDFGTRSIRHQPYNIFIFSDKGDAALNSFTSHLGHFCAFQGVSNLHQKSQNSERKYGRATIDRIQRTLGKTTIMWCKISSTHRNVFCNCSIIYLNQRVWKPVNSVWKIVIFQFASFSEMCDRW